MNHPARGQVWYTGINFVRFWLTIQPKITKAQLNQKPRQEFQPGGVFAPTNQAADGEYDDQWHHGRCTDQEGVEDVEGGGLIS